MENVPGDPCCQKPVCKENASLVIVPGDGKGVISNAQVTDPVKGKLNTLNNSIYMQMYVQMGVQVYASEYYIYIYIYIVLVTIIDSNEISICYVEYLLKKNWIHRNCFGLLKIMVDKQQQMMKEVYMNLVLFLFIPEDIIKKWKGAHNGDQNSLYYIC